MKFNHNRLKAERVARGLTVQEMGEVLGVSKGTYSKKENGKLPIDVDEFSLITNKFGIERENIVIFFTINVAEMETNERICV
ncbi:helix-turn-helix domain-containing protein [Lysinibacillus sp. NPDC096212]|uniref:helix-turn-helix domain-containing protein n=1 Tax=Lysinibacillus sp. NPDC096212 TaxID=3364135 RepID=UPI0037F7DCD9